MLKKLILTGLLGLSLVCTHEIKNELRIGYQYYEDNNEVLVHQPVGSISRSIGTGDSMSAMTSSTARL